MKPKITGFYVAIAVFAAIVAALVFFPSLSVEAVYPAGRAKRAFSDKVFARVVGFFRGAKASAENVRLKREIAALAMLSGDVERLEAENARLRRVLDYAKQRRERWLPAAVLSRSGGSVGESIRVGRGSLDGVCEGAVVMVPEGLVGQVASVTAHTAEVRLLSDPSLMVHCEVESPIVPKMRGVLAGGDEMHRLKYLTGAREAAVQSRVLTSGKGGVFPAGLLVGHFVGLRADPVDDTRQEAMVRPAVDFSMIEDVFIRRAQ